MEQFTFYEPYWDSVKDENDETVNSVITRICAFMFDGEETAPTDKNESII